MIGVDKQASDESRKDLAIIIGMWSRQRIVPYPIIDQINVLFLIFSNSPLQHKIFSICTTNEDRQAWQTNLMTKVVPRPAQPTLPTPSPSLQIRNFDDLEAAQSELNSFAINTDLLYRRVHPVFESNSAHVQTVLSQFEYVRDVFLYQLEQNKRNNVPQPEAQPVPAVLDIGPMHFEFDWEKDRKTLQSEGRRYLFNLGKNYRFACDQCGMLIRKEAEVGDFWNSESSTSCICRTICAIASCSSAEK